MFENIAKSYRKDFLIGFIKSSIEIGLYVHDVDLYRKEFVKMLMAIQEFEELEESDREYNGIF